MNKVQIVIACCMLTPAAMRAQDVRVRLYTLTPPESMVVRARNGELHWRTCPNCADTNVHEFSVSGVEESAGADIYLTGNYELRPKTGPPFAAGYPAHIERHNGYLLVTIKLPLEDYVAAVLGAESGDFQNGESQKSMAVVVRTYAMRFMGQHAKEGFDFCDTTHCQVFGWKHPKGTVQAAVDATRGETLRYDGKSAETFYHQNCGGKTAAAEEAWAGVKEAYLTSHADSYCTTHGTMLWESSIRVEDLDHALRKSGLRAPTGWQAIEIVSRSESGRAELLKLTGGTGDGVRVSASALRFAVGRELGWDKIRSNFYDVRNAGKDIVFSGRGSGHGVGLCQAGAEEMAREGKSYREILNFYYPSTLLAANSQSTAWQKRGAERVELLSTQADADASVMPLAEKILRDDEKEIGWRVPRVRLQVYSSLDTYRDTTGQPGWVAASTRGSTIRLQPLKELEKRGILEVTLRHEIFHILVEAKAKAATPLWFREGLVLYLANPDAVIAESGGMTDAEIETALRKPASREQMQKAYAAAQSRVSGLVQQRGKETVLGWLSGGIPGDVVRSSASSVPTNR